MAIQSHTAHLKLLDDAWKTLGVSRIVSASVTSASSPPLIEGTDFEIDYSLGRIRRLQEVPEGLHSFSMQYDNRAEEIAAQTAAILVVLNDLRNNAQAAVTRLDAIIANAQAADIAQLRTAIEDLARIQRRIVRFLVPGS